MEEQQLFTELKLKLELLKLKMNIQMFNMDIRVGTFFPH